MRSVPQRLVQPSCWFTLPTRLTLWAQTLERTGACGWDLPGV